MGISEVNTKKNMGHSNWKSATGLPAAHRMCRSRVWHDKTQESSADSRRKCWLFADRIYVFFLDDIFRAILIHILVYSLDAGLENLILIPPIHSWNLWKNHL